MTTPTNTIDENEKERQMLRSKSFAVSDAVRALIANRKDTSKFVYSQPITELNWAVDNCRMRDAKRGQS